MISPSRGDDRRLVAGLLQFGVRSAFRPAVALAMHATPATRWLLALRTFVLVALIARALIPPGFMLEAATESRSVKVVLCAAHGAVEAYVDRVTGEITTEAPAKKAPAGDPPCAFAALAKLAPPSAVAVVFAVAPAPFVRQPSAILDPGRGLSAPPPPSTGPPSLNA